MEMQEFLGLAGVPLIIALVELVKRAFPGLSNRYYPLVSLALGVALNTAIAYHLGTDRLEGAFLGLITGLVASGLYSGGKTVVNRSDTPDAERP
ncbi:MAG: hypothetical protein M1136_00970 [Chloroflexi bacterium]|nr:hypothetical protein [Chloroflexota bacterium]